MRSGHVTKLDCTLPLLEAFLLVFLNLPRTTFYSSLRLSIFHSSLSKAGRIQMPAVDLCFWISCFPTTSLDLQTSGHIWNKDTGRQANHVS